jgi:hypothetical protein
MVTLKLDPKWSEYLVRQPESGMGYQRVDLRLKGNKILRNILVFNGEEIQLPDEFVEAEIVDLKLSSELEGRSTSSPPPR